MYGDTEWVRDDSITFTGFDGEMIQTGDRVVFAVRDGNCAGMRIGTVIDVKHCMHRERNRKYLGGGEFQIMPDAYSAVFKIRVHVEQSSYYTKGNDVWVKDDLMVRLPSHPPTPYATGVLIDPIDDSFMEPVL